jgi:hypothetical protein
MRIQDDFYTKRQSQGQTGKADGVTAYGKIRIRWMGKCTTKECIAGTKGM